MAERLDPQLAEVHETRSFIAFSQYEGWQIETAMRELRLALEFDPSVGYAGLVDMYFHIGLERQAAEALDLGLNVDPGSDLIKEASINGYLISARPDEALAAGSRFFKRGPDLAFFIEKKMVNEAAPMLEEVLHRYPASVHAQIQRALLLALQGQHRTAEAAVPVLHRKLRRNRGYHHETYRFARIYALGGRAREAVKWLRITVEEGFPCYPLFARDSFLDPIRKDPAFIRFLTEMKERWEGYRRQFG
jgi:tetratricopeptide (TPR) repeat protein